MAEKEGFEPPVPFLAHLISSQAHSATLSLLLKDWKIIVAREGWQERTLLKSAFSGEGGGSFDRLLLRYFNGKPREAGTEVFAEFGMMLEKAAG